MPPVVTYAINGNHGAIAPVQGSVFAGKKFFLVQRLPTRSRYINDLEANGGKLVRLEDQADYIIADHMRKDAPNGSLSYTFIETAMKNGELPPEKEHLAGGPKGSIRPAGSSAPTKKVRTPFTAEDDRLLWNWVKDGEAKGVAVKGQILYKDLEAKNSRHTWQSWRERYDKHLRHKPPHPLPTNDNPPPVTDKQPATGPSAAGVLSAMSAQPATSAPSPAIPTTSLAVASNLDTTFVPAIDHEDALPVQSDLDDPSGQAEIAIIEDEEEGEVVVEEKDPAVGPYPVVEGFEEQWFPNWLSAAETIQATPVGKYNSAWEDFAEQHPEHTAHEWRDFYESYVLPIHMEMQDNDEESPAPASAEKQDKDEEAPAPSSAEKYRRVVRAFGTQGQPLYTPTKLQMSSTHATAAPKRARSESGEASGSVSKRPHLAADHDVPLGAAGHDGTSTRPEFSNAEAVISETQKTIITISSDANSESEEYEDEEDRTLMPSAMNAAVAAAIDEVDAAEDDMDNATEDDMDDIDVNTSEDDNLVQLQLRTEMDRGDTLSLTAENLRRADAESKLGTDSRATDIVLTYDRHDQGEFARELFGLVEGAAARGQVSQEAFEALKQKQQQLDAMESEEDQELEDYDRDDEPEQDNGESSEYVVEDNEEASDYVVMNDRRVSKRFLVDTQALDPGLDDSSDHSQSSPFREYFPDHAAPLNPDTSPSRASHQSSQQYLVRIPSLRGEDEDYVDDDDVATNKESESERDDDIRGQGPEDDDDLDESLEIVPPEGGWGEFSSPTTPRAAFAAQQEPSSSPPPRWKGKGRATDADLDLDFDVHAASRKPPTSAATAAAAKQPRPAKSIEPAKPRATVASPAVEPANEPAEQYDSQVLDNSKVNAIMEEYTQRHGLDESQVVDTFNRTSMRLPLVRTVLNALVAGKPVPSLPGVWTDAEDEWLESRDLVGLRRVRAKHGKEECEARLQFLKDFGDEEEE